MARFSAVPLLDKYDVYQILMSYWAEVMHDDVSVITQDGWGAAAVVRELVVGKGEKSKETPDLVVGKKKYKMELIPPDLIVNRYFREERARLDAAQAECERLAQELESFLEENLGDDGLLEGATTEAGSVTKASLKSRYKELKKPGDAAEMVVIQECEARMELEAAARKAVAVAQEKLDALALAKYSNLGQCDTIGLLIETKWFLDIRRGVEADIHRVTQALADRLTTLEERYADTLAQLNAAFACLTIKVDAHLRTLVAQGARL